MCPLVEINFNKLKRNLQMLQSHTTSQGRWSIANGVKFHGRF